MARQSLAGGGTFPSQTPADTRSVFRVFLRTFPRRPAGQIGGCPSPPSKYPERPPHPPRAPRACGVEGCV